MGNYVLSCSSTADLRREHFEARNIHYICFHFELGNREYMDDLGQSISLADFYQAMANGESTKTSQINVEEYEQYFEGFLKEGLDILHLTLSSGISGTINSALIARDTLSEKYPERRIYVLDSLAASSGYGLLMDKLADLRDDGMELEELYHWAEDNRLKLQHWFFTSDLTYLIRGGRVSKAAGLVGSMLNICPLLNVDYQGRLINRAKVRTKRKVIQATVDKMKKHAQDGADYCGKCYISQSACMEDARAVAELVEAAFPKMQGKVEINDIGTTIGSHTGPGTVALFFWGDRRVD